MSELSDEAGFEEWKPTTAPITPGQMVMLDRDGRGSLGLVVAVFDETDDDLILTVLCGDEQCVQRRRSELAAADVPRVRRKLRELASKLGLRVARTSTEE